MIANPRQHDGHRGMTLLELILVMMILSTVLAMAAPSLRGFFISRRGDDAAAQILAMTQYARSQAVSEGVIYRLNLDVQQRTYWLTAQKSGDYERLENEFGRTFAISKDLVLEVEDVVKEGREAFLEFSPYGTVTAATIRLIDRQGRALEITCPTATESFSITECEEVYKRYASQ
ncbi:MAG: GspH/FimT family pseudopilin [Phycisphaerae bacterium]|nr:GspH/FimT family pseudopilin [Phycisphaerae bacterium]